MRSRQLGGKGVDPREKKSGELTNVNADELIMRTIVPLFDDREPAHQEWIDTKLPALTLFVVNETHLARNMVVQMRQDCPGITCTRERFMACMDTLFTETEV